LLHKEPAEENGAAVPPEELRDFFQKLTAYVKARRLYPEGHGRPKKQLELWLEATRSILTRCEELTVFIRTDRVEICGEVFGSAEKVIVDFIPEFVRRSIRFVALKQGTTASDLRALGEVFLREPEEVETRGGPAVVLAQLGAERVFLIEYAEEARKLLESYRCIQDLRRIATLQGEEERETEIVKHLLRKQLDAEEVERLRQLLENEEIRRRLELIKEDLTKLNPGTDSSLAVLDLPVELIQQAYKAKTETPEAEDEDEVEAVVFLLDLAQRRIREALQNPDSSETKRLRQTVASPEPGAPIKGRSIVAALFAGPEVALPELPSSLIKTILRKLRKQGAELGVEALFAEAGAPKKRDAEGGWEEEPAEDLEALEGSLASLRDKLGAHRLEINFAHVALAHIDILLEILRREKPGPLRIRIRKRLEQCVSACCGNKEEDIGPSVVNRLVDERTGFPPGELAELLHNEAILVQAIRGFLMGEARWAPFFEERARLDRAGFAEHFVRTALRTESSLDTEVLRPVVEACGSELVKCLRRLVYHEEKKISVRRLLSLLKINPNVEAIPLMGELLPRVPSPQQRELMELMAEMDKGRAAGTLAPLVLNAPPKTARNVIRFLGGLNHSLAQEALLDLLSGSRRGECPKELQYEAIEALERGGTVEAARTLEGLGSRWSLLFTASGRELRRRLRRAARAIRRRNMGR